MQETSKTLSPKFRPNIREAAYRVMAAYAEVGLDPADAISVLAGYAGDGDRGTLFRKLEAKFSEQPSGNLGVRLAKVFTTAHPVELTIMAALDQASGFPEQVKLLDRAAGYLAAQDDDGFGA